MNTWEKRTRLDDIDKQLIAQQLKPEEEMFLIYQAMQLCEDLGLDRAWQRFKALQERNVRNAINHAKGA